MPLIEKRYAEALVDLSMQKNAVDLYLNDLGTIKDVYNNQADFKNFLLNPETDRATKKEAFQKIFGGKLSNELLGFLMLLLDKERIKHLPGIYDEFVKLSDKRRNILNMTIVSPAPLESEQLDILAEKYRKKYNSLSVKVNFKLDESLIGGVRIEIGDKLIDGSVQGRLKELHRILVK